MGGYLDAIAELVRNPTSNLTATAFGLAIVVLVLLILILAVVAYVLPPADTSSRRQRVGDEIDVMGPADDWRHPWAVVVPAWTIVTMFAIGIAATYWATSSDTYCTSVCHQMTSASDSWDASTHREIACIRCHEGAPVVSALSGVAYRLQSAVGAWTPFETDGATEIPSARCLACHEDILDVEDAEDVAAVRLEHAHILETGPSCSLCHGNVGHEQPIVSRGSIMSECLRCHDGGSASADCEICHVGDPGLSSIRDRTFQPVELPAPTCEGCHSMNACDACHGLRMPHPPGFADPRSHARLGAFDGRERLCYRCHTFADCDPCHLPFEQHGTGWKLRHTASPSGSCSCHGTQPEDFCEVCHG
jgi:cytochrome c nitrite reductase small subunit